MKKLIFILAALFFLDLSVQAQRSGRSSERTNSRSSKKEQAVKSSSSSRSSAARSSSNRSSATRSSNSNRSSTVKRSSSSRSKEYTPSSNNRSSSRSKASRSVSPSSGSSSNRSSGYNNRSSNRNSGYNSSNRSSQSSESGYSNRGRSNSPKVNRSSSQRNNSSYRSGNNRSSSSESINNRRYRSNDNNGVRNRTSSGNSRISERNSDNRKSVRSSASRIERTKPDTRRTYGKRIERRTSDGVVVETRGTTYRKNVNVVREVRVVHRHVVRPRPIEYRRVHYVYRAPRRVNFFWSVNIYNDFCNFYPRVTRWHYRTGARISTVSAYDAMFFVGEVKRVYGEVQEVFYSREDDAYYLYIGAPFPYHDFSVVIPGREYRRFNFPPINRMNFQHIWAMGLITQYDERPEIVVKRPYQLGVY